MKILILNGNPSQENTGFDEYLERLGKILTDQGHETRDFKLRDAEINNCIGCYSCWLKTPGICVYKDSMPEILTEFNRSDLVILTSPVIMGYSSSGLKKVQERLLPLTLPYLYIEGDRMQHVRRYKKSPLNAVLLDDSIDDNSARLDIIKKMFEGVKTRKYLFTKTMNNSVEEIANEINGI